MKKNKLKKRLLISIIFFLIFIFTVVTINNETAKGMVKNAFASKETSSTEISENSNTSENAENSQTASNENIDNSDTEITEESTDNNITLAKASTTVNIMGNTSYTEAIPSVLIESEDYANNIPGSWHIDKSAEWTSAKTAKVTFDVNSILKEVENQKYKDVILVLDISSSMNGSKIAKVKSDAIELTDSLLQNTNNKVSLITFATSSEKVLDFTNDKDTVVSKINSMSAYGTTNYNAALKNVDSIMENYTFESNRDLITLFLTDGYPCEDTPNQVGTFQLLKNKYPDMKVNGIQYEMGSSIKQELKEVSDMQWFADMETLNNVLFDASTVNPVKYDGFEIVDYIDKDYYVLNSEDDIEVTVGKVKLEEENGLQKIIWTIGKKATGFKAKMYIDLQLKDEYVDSKGFYSTNDSEKITYTLENEEKHITSDKTPVLEKKQYKVAYDINAPDGSTADTAENTEEEHSPLVKVTKKNTTPTIDGYNFKGWEIVTDGVIKVSENVFEMPENDVVIRATWTKHGIAKRMDGTVKLAKVDVKVGNTVNYSPSGTYTWQGKYALSDSTTDTTLDSSTSDFKITKWKVLSVDESTGKVQIVPATAKSTERKVRLNGAQGYNNAVKLLNDACSSLYSDAENGITARSINVEDIEEILKKENYDIDIFKTNFKNYTNIYYGKQYTSAYTGGKYYPVIYAREKLAVINGTTPETASLGLSEQNEFFIERSEATSETNTLSGSFNSIGSITNANSIQPYQTFYYMNDNTFSSALGKYSEILLPNGSSTYYWVASRNVQPLNRGFCYFNVCSVYYGYLSAKSMMDSYCYTYSEAYGLFPVVSLNSSVLIETAAETFDVK